jgi:uncharacterized protein YoxC
MTESFMQGEIAFLWVVAIALGVAWYFLARIVLSVHERGKLTTQTLVSMNTTIQLLEKNQKLLIDERKNLYICWRTAMKQYQCHLKLEHGHSDGPDYSKMSTQELVDNVEGLLKEVQKIWPETKQTEKV